MKKCIRKVMVEIDIKQCLLPRHFNFQVKGIKVLMKDNELNILKHLNIKCLTYVHHCSSFHF